MEIHYCNFHIWPLFIFVSIQNRSSHSSFVSPRKVRNLSIAVLSMILKIHEHSIFKSARFLPAPKTAHGISKELFSLLLADRNLNQHSSFAFQLRMPLVFAGCFP